MATGRQKSAARRHNMSRALTTQRRNRMPGHMFAFARKRKEPINDARHVRNAVARFDQVEGVTIAERDRAWRRIREAARRFGVKIEVRGWRALMKGGKTGRARRRR